MSNRDEDLSLTETGSRTFAYINPYTGVIESQGTTPNVVKASKVRKVYKGGLRLKPKGWLFPTPYEFFQQDVRYPSGFVQYNEYGYLNRFQGDLFGIIEFTTSGRPYGIPAREGNPFPDVDQQSQAEAKALTKLLQHGKERDGLFNVGVAWMERKETADLLNSAASTMLKTITDLRNGNVKRAFQDLFPHGSKKDWAALKGTPYYKWYKDNFRKGVKSIPVSPNDLASGYLALQNGWKPFLSDVNNAAEALANRNSPEHWVITGKGYYKKVVKGAIVPGTGHIFKRYEWLYESVTSCFCRLDATVLDPFIHRMTQLGLHGVSAFHSAYEATRLSYVFDYFFEMGTWLQAMGAPAGLEFYSGSVTRYGKLTASLKSVDGGANASFKGSWEQCRWDRKPLDQWPVPIPPLSLKPKPLKLLQVLNIVALCETMTSGKPSRYLTG